MSYQNSCFDMIIQEYIKRYRVDPQDYFCPTIKMDFYFCFRINYNKKFVSNCQ